MEYPPDAREKGTLASYERHEPQIDYEALGLAIWRVFHDGRNRDGVVFVILARFKRIPLVDIAREMCGKRNASSIQRPMMNAEQAITAEYVKIVNELNYATDTDK